MEISEGVEGGMMSSRLSDFPTELTDVLLRRHRETRLARHMRVGRALPRKKGDTSGKGRGEIFNRRANMKAVFSSES
jgi:hypothetical protein